MATKKKKSKKKSAPAGDESVKLEIVVAGKHITAHVTNFNAAKLEQFADGRQDADSVEVDASLLEDLFA